MTEDLSLQPQKRTRLIAHLLAFITIFIWSTTYVSTKLLLINFTPTEIQFFRLVIAYLALFIVKPGFIKYKNIKEELTFAGAGLCGITLYFGLKHGLNSYNCFQHGCFGICCSFFTTIFIFSTR